VVLDLKAMSFRTQGRSVRLTKVLNRFLLGSGLAGASSAGFSGARVEVIMGFL